MNTGIRKYGPSWILIILLGMLSLSSVMAQDPAFFSQHIHNPLVYNPAFAGHREIPGFSLLTRQQWLGWEGSPSSTNLLLHTRMKNKNAGVGIALAYDGMGPVHAGGISGAYSYSVQLSEKNRMIFGLQGELGFRQIKLSQLQLVDQGDLLFAEDPQTRLLPNVGLGIRFMSGKSSVHLSVPRLLNSKLSPYEGETSKWSTTTRVFYMGANTRFELSEEFEVVPSLLLALSRGNSPFVEVSGLLDYRKQFGVGMLYRFNKTIGAMIKYKHREKYVFGYAYDVSLNILHYNAGSHELYLGYNFRFNRTKNLSPRRF
jgi:type IX secretion system PorP/SprF family membrane protein